MIVKKQKEPLVFWWEESQEKNKCSTQTPPLTSKEHHEKKCKETFIFTTGYLSCPLSLPPSRYESWVGLEKDRGIFCIYKKQHLQ